MPTADDLIGTWKVTGFQEWSKDGQAQHPIGKQPVGYAVFDKSGRIFIQLGRNPADASAEAAAAAFMCYFGTYSVSGETLNIAIETGNTAHDVASRETRTITLDGERLTIGIPGQFGATLQRLPDDAAETALTGVWRVASFRRFAKDGTPNEPLGAPPAGYAVFDRTGRAYVQLGKAPGVGSAEDVAKSLMCYFGPCSIAADVLSVVVESSNMKAYIGSTQTRKFRIDGDTLTIGTPGEYQAVATRVT